MNLAGKLPYVNDRFASWAMTCENVSLAALSTDIGTKLSGDDLSDIDDNMASTSLGEIVVKLLRCSDHPHVVDPTLVGLGSQRRA